MYVFAIAFCLQSSSQHVITTTKKQHLIHRAHLSAGDLLRAERKKDKELKALSSNNNDHVGNKDKKKNSKPSSNRQTSHLKLHDAVTIEDAIRHTSRHVNRHGKLHCKQLCAFWSRVASLISVSPNWKCDARSKPRYKQQLKSILTRTVNMIFEFGPRELVGTILGMAKVVKHVPQLGDDWRIELFHELLDGSKKPSCHLQLLLVNVSRNAMTRA